MTTTVELDLRAVLNENAAIPCEDERCDGQPARWRWIAFCGCSSLICDKHAEGCREWLACDAWFTGWCEVCKRPFAGSTRNSGRVVPFG